MSLFFIVLVGILIICLFIFGISFFLRKRLPLPDGDVVYSDTGVSPGEVLSSASIALVGKPDYVLKKNGNVIPVEVKTGKTPSVPYKNHVAQLMAYCFLVHEQYGKRPPYGIIRYPEREFPLEYTEAAEAGVKQTVTSILARKQQGTYRASMQTVCKACSEGKHPAHIT